MGIGYVVSDMAAVAWGGGGAMIVTKEMRSAIARAITQAAKDHALNVNVPLDRCVLLNAVTEALEAVEGGFK